MGPGRVPGIDGLAAWPLLCPNSPCWTSTCFTYPQCPCLATAWLALLSNIILSHLVSLSWPASEHPVGVNLSIFPSCSPLRLFAAGICKLFGSIIIDLGWRRWRVSLDGRLFCCFSLARPLSRRAMLSILSTCSHAARIPVLAPTARVGTIFPVISAARHHRPASALTTPLRLSAVQREAPATTFRPSSAMYNLRMPPSTREVPLRQLDWTKISPSAAMRAAHSDTPAMEATPVSWTRNRRTRA